MNNTSGPRVEAAKAYGELLEEKFNLPIDFIDERLTTVEAERMRWLNKLMLQEKA